MTDVAADPTVIEVDQFYPHSPERVWRALTTPDLMARWLMEPAGFAPVVGTRFTFRGQPMPSVGFSGEIVCEVPTWSTATSLRSAGPTRALTSRLHGS